MQLHTRRRLCGVQTHWYQVGNGSIAGLRHQELGADKLPAELADGEPGVRLRLVPVDVA